MASSGPPLLIHLSVSQFVCLCVCVFVCVFVGHTKSRRLLWKPGNEVTRSSGKRPALLPESGFWVGFFRRYSDRNDRELPGAYWYPVIWNGNCNTVLYRYCDCICTGTGKCCIILYCTRTVQYSTLTITVTLLCTDILPGMGIVWYVQYNRQ